MNKKILHLLSITLLMVLLLAMLKQMVVYKPMIGIPGSSRVDYAEAVRKAGGIPMHLSYDDRDEIPKMISNLDAVLFTGGADVPPSVYGEETVHPTVKPVSDERLSFEYTFAKAWLKETNKPFLGVCLGCQMLNVVQGGTLVQDIPSEFGGDHRVDHDVSVEPGSKLYSILKQETVPVNSSHHQCVKDLGEGLKIVAKAPDGIVEAIEMEGERFVLGVQWHPERMKGDELQQEIFKTFVKEASRRKKITNPR